MATRDETISKKGKRVVEQRLRSDMSVAEIEAKPITERVLDSAQLVLLHHGYASFSTRRVAQEAGIALGNLTYHFPTKAELVRALIDRLMSSYLAYFEEVLSVPGEGLETLVRWLLEVAPDEAAMRLFREIWAMALHDDIVRKSIDDFYDLLIERVTETLIAAHPKANPRALNELVHFVAVMSEGSSVIYGTRNTRATPRQRLVELAMRMVPVIAGDLELAEQKSTTPVHDE